ncbi:hypothetical protein [Aliarcobacter cryaerophilus]|uniref:hypothetical protein n=1 Tax=Aliarcobacter cryaerophilus TaxID=28198 RepID=UPI003BB1FA10
MGISEELENIAFLNVPKGFWADNNNRTAISNMKKDHIKRSINMIREKYIINCLKGNPILILLEKKIEELEEELKRRR